jgi:Na+-driven multidrug efflux pump
LGGRRIVNRIVARAVMGWPIPVLEQCDAGETQIVAQHYTKSVERAVKAEYGMGILLTLVLSALVSEVVKILVRWWLESRENKEAMRLLTSEARHHD